MNDGAIRPGGANAIGTLTIVGPLAQGPNGLVEIEAAGTAPGQFDVLNVGGALTGTVAGNLGTLSVQAIGTYVPAAGDTLAFMTYGSRAGVFTALIGFGFDMSEISRMKNP